MAKNNKNTLDLAEQIYGAGDERVKQLKQAYNETREHVVAMIAAFIAGKTVWTKRASTADVLVARALIVNAMRNTQLKPLLATAINVNNIVNEGDVLKAKIIADFSKPVALQHAQIDKIGKTIPSAVEKYVSDANPLGRRPVDYGKWLEQALDYDPHASINSSAATALRKINKTVDLAIKSHQEPANFTGDVAKILTGDKNTNGLAGHAGTIIRTQTCHVVNQAKLAEMHSRSVKYYKFYSLEARNTCADCRDLDGNVFRLGDASEGTNYPPIHGNCQCWVEEVIDPDDNRFE